MDYRTLLIQDSYYTAIEHVPMIKRMFPSFFGYYSILSEIIQCSLSVKKLSDEEALPIILKHIYAIMCGIGNLGVQYCIENMQYTKGDSPVIIIANHMSSLETILITLLAGGKFPVSFVAKRSIMSYPFFKHIFAKLQPLLVERINPREDFKIVMNEGAKRLEQGRNIIIFPQGTRKTSCLPEDFSSIGVKLARATSTPIVPLALKTDAWSTGKFCKDIGTIRRVPVKFKFFPPIKINSKNGKEEHEECLRIICSTVNTWV